MRKILLLSICLISSNLFAQFVSPFTTLVDSNGVKVEDTITHHVYLIAAGDGDALFLQTISAEGKMQLKFKITQGFDGMMGVNVGGTVIKAENSDSVPLSSIYFPNAANASFIGQVEMRFFRIKNNFSVWAVGDVSLEQRDIIDNNSMDSTAHNFSIINFDAGLKLKWEYPAEKAIISETLLFDRIEVDDNTGNNFDIVFNDNPNSKRPLLPTVFSGFSTLTQVSVANMGLYLRTFSDGGKSTSFSYMVGATVSIPLEKDPCPCNN